MRWDIITFTCILHTNQNITMRFKSLYLPLFFLLFFCFNLSLAQDDDYYEDDTYEEVEYLSPLNDKSLEGQKQLNIVIIKKYRYSVA